MIVAVITSFRPDDEMLDNLSTIIPQVAAAIVIDDGSGDDADAVLAEAEARGAEVIRQPSNLGIAAALNRGVRRARELGAEAVVTFDQDSAITPGFVDALSSALESARAAGMTPGFAVPEFFASVRQATDSDANGVQAARQDAIQSGMLIPLLTTDAVGAFREELFIDLVDLDFVLRCVEAGLGGVAATGLRLVHQLGRQYERRMFGMPVPFLGRTTTYSAPFRYYYRVRNRVVVNAWHKGTRSTWLRNATVAEALYFLQAVGAARPRRSLLLIYRRAVSDARARRLGPARPEILDIAAGIRWDAKEIVPTSA